MPNRIVQILGIFPQSLPFQGPQCSLFHLPTQMLPILLSSKKTSVVPSALNDYFFFYCMWKQHFTIYNFFHLCFSSPHLYLKASYHLTTECVATIYMIKILQDFLILLYHKISCVFVKLNYSNLTCYHDQFLQITPNNEYRFEWTKKQYVPSLSISWVLAASCFLPFCYLPVIYALHRTSVPQIHVWTEEAGCELNKRSDKTIAFIPC